MPGCGRFVAEDPIGLLGGQSNFYIYVAGDPVNFADPLGLSGSSGGDRFPGSACGPEGNPRNYWADFGFTNINEACKKHDSCYATCGASRAMCDVKFAWNIVTTPSLSPGMNVPLGVAYGSAVRAGGGEPFEKAQFLCVKHK